MKCLLWLAFLSFIVNSTKTQKFIEILLDQSSLADYLRSEEGTSLVLVTDEISPEYKGMTDSVLEINTVNDESENAVLKAHLHFFLPNIFLMSMRS